MASVSILLYNLDIRNKSVPDGCRVDDFFTRYRYYEYVLSMVSKFVYSVADVGGMFSIPHCGLVVATNNTSYKSSSMLYPGCFIIWNDDIHDRNLLISLMLSKSLDMSLLYRSTSVIDNSVYHVHVRKYYVSVVQYDKDSRLMTVGDRSFRINNAPFVMKGFGVTGDMAFCLLEHAGLCVVFVSSGASMPNNVLPMFRLVDFNCVTFTTRDSVSECISKISNRDTVLGRMVAGGGLSTDFLRWYKGGQFVGVHVI